MNRRSGITRRALIGSAAAAGLAGCENTTTPIPVAGGAAGPGLLGDPTAGGPVDAFGIPLARRDYPVTLPRVLDATTATAPERGGELKVFNYADYLNPRVLKAFGREEGVSVRVTTYTTPDEAFTKVNSGQEFDVIFTSPEQISKYVGSELIQPLNLDLVPNLAQTVWPELRSPAYDVESRYTVPYTTYTTGIGWRNDRVDLDVEGLGWDAFWAAGDHRGRVAILDDERESLGMALLRRGELNLNTEDPAKLAQAGRDLAELKDRVGIKISIGGYETLPAGRLEVAHVWSGDMVNAVISYLPNGTPPTVLSYWSQADGGPVFNDVICVGAKARKPVMAHRFMDYLLDADVAYENFVGYVGYQPPISAIDPRSLTREGVIPEQLSSVILTREDYATGNAYLGLTARGERQWDTTWSEFRSG